MNGGAKYRVLIKNSAEKELDSLPAHVRRRVAKALLSLESQPRRFGAKKLRGTDTYRCRIGDYRILYLIDDANHVVEVFAVANRKDAYR